MEYSGRFQIRTPRQGYNLELSSAPSALQGVSRRGYSVKQWETARPIIYRLYIEESKTLEDVMVVMAMIYNFRPTVKMYTSRLSSWPECRKNTRAREAEQASIQYKACRKRIRRKPKEFIGLEAAFFRGLAIMASVNAPLKNRGWCAHQETVLDCVHNFICGLFESHRWQADQIEFIPPAKSLNMSGIWQQLSDQAFEAWQLIRESNMKEAGRTLNHIFNLLRTAASSFDPSVMVKFWRISRYLLRICETTENQQILTIFFRDFRLMLSIYHSPTHPLIRLLQTLQEIPREILPVTLKIGYLKSIHSLATFGGWKHAVVLSMWSNYLKEWDASRFAEAKIQKGYERLFADSELIHGKFSQRAVSILHSFTYAAYYNIGDDVKAFQLASDLLDRAQNSLSRNGPYQWDPFMLAFAFASKVLAEFYHRNGNILMSRTCYQSAITVLQKGDRNCRIRAGMLMKEMH